MTASSAASSSGAQRSSTSGRAPDDAGPAARGKPRFRERLAAPLTPRGERQWPRKRRADEREATGPAVGGPLSHQSCRAPDAVAGETAATRVTGPTRLSQVADRILTGVDAAGRPQARIELNFGAWAGVDVDLVAGARGLELNVFAATAAARRTIQAQLSDLADALAERGLHARKLQVSVRRRDNRGGTRQDDRR